VQWRGTLKFVPKWIESGQALNFCIWILGTALIITWTDPLMSQMVSLSQFKISYWKPASNWSSCGHHQCEYIKNNKHLERVWLPTPKIREVLKEGGGSNVSFENDQQAIYSSYIAVTRQTWEKANASRISENLVQDGVSRTSHVISLSNTQSEP